MNQKYFLMRSIQSPSTIGVYNFTKQCVFLFVICFHMPEEILVVKFDVTPERWLNSTVTLIFLGPGHQHCDRVTGARLVFMCVCVLWLSYLLLVLKWSNYEACCWLSLQREEMWYLSDNGGRETRVLWLWRDGGDSREMCQQKIDGARKNYYLT